MASVQLHLGPEAASRPLHAGGVPVRLTLPPQSLHKIAIQFGVAVRKSLKRRRNLLTSLRCSRRFGTCVRRPPGPGNVERCFHGWRYPFLSRSHKMLWPGRQGAVVFTNRSPPLPPSPLYSVAAVAVHLSLRAEPVFRTPALLRRQEQSRNIAVGVKKWVPSELGQSRKGTRGRQNERANSCTR
jgi:hypothetical protein